MRALMDFYGAGLARIVALLGADRAARRWSGCCATSRCPALLVLHDLHPERRWRPGSPARWRGLPGRPVELVGFDEAHRHAAGARPPAAGGCGCPSTGGRRRQAVEEALACFATEVTAVELEAAAVPRASRSLLQIGAAPGPRWTPP